MGKPTVATAAKGRSILEAVANDVAAFLREFAAWPECQALGPR
jgi:creatinine amidohydrolase/Fe(II)-dependent formamide hydrolase-like protein